MFAFPKIKYDDVKSVGKGFSFLPDKQKAEEREAEETKTKYSFKDMS